jgi:hypothetical protein
MAPDATVKTASDTSDPEWRKKIVTLARWRARLIDRNPRSDKFSPWRRPTMVETARTLDLAQIFKEGSNHESNKMCNSACEYSVIWYHRVPSSV